MKYSLFIVVLLSFIGCKKENPNDFVADPADYYQSQGNLLVLVLSHDGNFNYAHEYSLDSIILSNDSIQMEVQDAWTPPGNTFSGIMQPFNDTIYSHGESYFGAFRGEKIQSSKFYRNSIKSPYSIDDTQIIDSIPGGVDYQLLWDNIAGLDIVKKYREHAPNSKIGYMYKYTPDNLAYNSGPKLKNCIILTKP